MDLVILALRRAAADLFAPRIFGLLLWPMGGALLLWGLLAWWFGPEMKMALESWLTGTPFQEALSWAGAEWLLAYAAVGLLVLLWLPAVYVTALLITSTVLMPVIVAHVAGHHHAGLAARQGGSLPGSLVNAGVALALFGLAWLLLLPLWLFAPFGVAVSILLNAWLNQRLFLYDALADHADPAELRAARRRGGWPLFGLSALLGVLHFVPVVNLLAPVYMGLAFAHYALEALERDRN